MTWSQQQKEKMPVGLVFVVPWAAQKAAVARNGRQTNWANKSSCWALRKTQKKVVIFFADVVVFALLSFGECYLHLVHRNSFLSIFSAWLLKVSGTMYRPANKLKNTWSSLRSWRHFIVSLANPDYYPPRSSSCKSFIHAGGESRNKVRLIMQRFQETCPARQNVKGVRLSVFSQLL